jgi:putative membrane protein
MNFFKDFMKGLLIGIGAVAPGVSGGALAVIFGLYEKITDAIAGIFKNFKENVLYFMPIALGGGVGVLVFSKLMQYLFMHYEVQVKYLFIGLMIGTLPTVFRQANKKGFRGIYLLPFATALSLTIISVIVENAGINIIPETNRGLLWLIIYGAIIGIGTIVPGISASFVLMYIGAYQIVLDGIADVELAILLPVGIGFAVSIVLFAKLVSFLFKRFYGYTYYTVLGFVLGSIIVIFPGAAFELKYLVSTLLFIIGFYLSYSLSKYSKDA